MHRQQELRTIISEIRSKFALLLTMAFAFDDLHCRNVAWVEWENFPALPPASVRMDGTDPSNDCSGATALPATWRMPSHPTSTSKKCLLHLDHTARWSYGFLANKTCIGVNQPCFPPSTRLSAPSLNIELVATLFGGAKPIASNTTNKL